MAIILQLPQTIIPPKNYTLKEKDIHYDTKTIYLIFENGNPDDTISVQGSMEYEFLSVADCLTKIQSENDQFSNAQIIEQ